MLLFPSQNCHSTIHELLLISATIKYFSAPYIFAIGVLLASDTLPSYSVTDIFLVQDLTFPSNLLCLCFCIFKETSSCILIGYFISHCQSRYTSDKFSFLDGLFLSSLATPAVSLVTLPAFQRSYSYLQISETNNLIRYTALPLTFPNSFSPPISCQCVRTRPLLTRAASCRLALPVKHFA